MTHGRTKRRSWSAVQLDRGLFPTCTTKNEGLNYELKKGGVPQEEIPHLENLINQMVRSFKVVKIPNEHSVITSEKDNIVSYKYYIIDVLSIYIQIYYI